MAMVIAATEVVCPMPTVPSSSATVALLKSGTRTELAICEISRPASVASTKSSICTESTADALSLPDLSTDSLEVSYGAGVLTPHEHASPPERALSPTSG